MLPVHKTPYDYDNLTIGNMYNLLLYGGEVYTCYRLGKMRIYVEWNIKGNTYCMDIPERMLYTSKKVRQFAKSCNRSIVRQLKKEENHEILHTYWK